MSTIFSPSETYLSHKNNLLQKNRIAPSDEIRRICAEMGTRYHAYLAAIDEAAVLRGELTESVRAVGEYLDYAKEIEKKFPFFNWRSDFASSILPEFLYRILGISFVGAGVNALFSTKNSAVEVSLSGNAGGGWDLRRKNQDLCIGLRTEAIVREAGSERFMVPLIATEVKTNIDINKLNGLDFSAERLKRTFPAARYILVTETIDFSLSDNYASGSIDEIYTLRKQLRSKARKEKEALKPDVFEQLQSDFVIFMRKASETRGHVYDRLLQGKLINE